MIVFNKSPSHTSKRNISLARAKDDRRAGVAKIKKITKENKKFLQDLGFKLGNATNNGRPVS